MAENLNNQSVFNIWNLTLCQDKRSDMKIGSALHQLSQGICGLSSTKGWRKRPLSPFLLSDSVFLWLTQQTGQV